MSGNDYSSEKALPDRYPAGLRRIHWLMAVLLPSMVLLGLWMGSLSRGHDLKTLLLNWLLMLGCVLLLLVILRIRIRLKSDLPSRSSGYSEARKRLVSVVHSGFYLIMISLPILGLSVWAIDPFVGGPGLFGEAVWVSNLAGVLHRMHYLGAWLLCVLLFVHVIGGLGKSDGKQRVFKRML